MYPDNNTIMISDTKGVSVVDINSIVRIEALSSYSRIFLTDGKQITVSKVLKYMEGMLEGKGFARIHRSHLVNTAWIQSYNLYHLRVQLYNSEQISISRRKGPQLRRSLAQSFLTNRSLRMPA
jgi:two-component system, LytTR family, response regulator